MILADLYGVLENLTYRSMLRFPTPCLSLPRIQLWIIMGCYLYGGNCLDWGRFVI